MEQFFVFAIPCNHSAARTGVVYCAPIFYNSPNLQGQYVYFLADTKKVVAELERTDPEMLRHASNKRGFAPVEDWIVKASTGERALETGQWGYHRDQLHLAAGSAGLVDVFREIDLPFFPIAVAKFKGPAAIDEMRTKIGYPADLNLYRKNLIEVAASHRAAGSNR